MSHFLGDVSPQGEPERYLQAVRSLHAWYCHHSKGTGQQRWAPLVVNTHGWIQVRNLPADRLHGMYGGHSLPTLYRQDGEWSA
jgi:hypothetical protein